MRVILIALSLVLTASTVAAQEAVTVDLGTDAVVPGEQTNISVVVSTEGAPKIGSIHFEAAFPPKILSFVEVSKSSGDRAPGLQVKAEVVSSPGHADESILRVDLSAPEPIPQGPLVILKFEVAKDAPGDSQLTLKAGKTAARSVDGREIATQTIDATLTILAPNSDAFACFFYMH